MAEDYRGRGASQIEGRQESGTATIDDPSSSQTVTVTFEEPFAEAPDIVGLAPSDANAVNYSNVTTDSFDITTAGTGGDPVDVGWIATGPGRPGET